MLRNFEIIFDNCGGIQLQGYKWLCTYHGGQETCAANDAFQIMRGASPIADGWDLNPAEYRLDPTYEQIRNGAYRVWVMDNLRDALAWPADEIRERAWGYAQAQFVQALQETATRNQHRGRKGKN